MEVKNLLNEPCNGKLQQRNGCTMPRPPWFGFLGGSLEMKEEDLFFGKNRHRVFRPTCRKNEPKCQGSQDMRTHVTI